MKSLLLHFCLVNYSCFFVEKKISYNWNFVHCLYFVQYTKFLHECCFWYTQNQRTIWEPGVQYGVGFWNGCGDIYINFFVKSVHTIIYFKIFQYGNNNKKNDANNEDELSKLEELKFSPSNESNEVNDSEKKDISTAVASSSTASSMTSTASPTIPNNAQLNSTSSHSRQSSQVSNFTKKNDKKNSFFNL